MSPVPPVRLVLLCLALLAGSASPALADGVLRVGINGPGSVTGTGINCSRALGGTTGGDCSQLFEDEKVCELDDRGKPVCHMEPRGTALRATPGVAGFVFDGWSGDCTGSTCSVALSDDRSVTANFRDNAPPTVGLSGVAAGAVLRGSVTLNASANDNAGVTRVIFAVGGTTLVDTAAPYTATLPIGGMKDGSYQASATAFDAAGLSAVSGVAVTVDNTAPSLGVNGPTDGAAFMGGSTQTWTLAPSDPTSGVKSVVCSVVPMGAPAAFGACSGGASGHSVSGKAHGAYVFTARATDGAGNVTDVARGFSIDAVAPTTTITAGLADGASTTDASLAWAFTASEPGVTFACRVYPAALTPGAFAPCSAASEHLASGFAPGTYAFEVRATDGVGNAESTPDKRVFTVAAAPPPPPIVVVTPDPTATPESPAPGGGGGNGGGPSGLSAAAKSGDSSPQIRVSVTFTFSSSTKQQTKLSSLMIRGVPAGSTVSAKGFKKTNASGNVSLKSLLKKPFKAGTEITVTISHPAMSTAIKTIKILPRKAPVVTTKCQPAGAKPKAC